MNLTKRELKKKLKQEQYNKDHSKKRKKKKEKRKKKMSPILLVDHSEHNYNNIHKRNKIKMETQSKKLSIKLY